MPMNSARVVWHQGLFLRPQHFQQLERFVEQLLGERLSCLSSLQHGWLNLAVHQPEPGKLSIEAGRGVFPDGTPFEWPSDSCRLEPYVVPEGTRDEIVYLSAVMRNESSKAFAMSARGPSTADLRYATVVARIPDSVLLENAVGPDDAVDMHVGALRLKLGNKSTLGGERTSLPLARVTERGANGQLRLDPTFIPPLLDISANARSRSWLDDLYGLIRQRGDTLSARIGRSATSGAGRIDEFLLLMLCNRIEPVLAQLRQTAPLHPFDLYRELLGLAGECATFGRETRKVPALPTYQHDAIDSCYEPVVDEIRRAMAKVIDQTATQIPLRDLGGGIYVAELPDSRMVRSGTFVLACFARTPADQIRNLVPRQVKVGPTDTLQNLVTYNVPGIGLQAYTYPPRQIPLLDNYIYFELDRASEHWSSIEAARALGFFVAGDLPELTMQLWGISKEGP